MPGSAANKRRFQAGREKRFIDEKFSEHRVAWLKTFAGQFILRIAQREESDPSEYGDSVQLLIPRPNAKPLTIGLTTLTGEEVRLMRQFFNTVFDIVEPLCDERDKVATDAYNRGDDSHIRLYRSVPELIVRTGAVGEYGQIIRDRLESLSVGPEHYVDPTRALREPSPPVATGQPSDDEREDDESEADES